MNRIINVENISTDNPIAVIEPGVTQRQLYDFLQEHAPALKFNVTGAGENTSIVGNALDRGVGYLGPRKDDLFGLEIVTGTGEIIQTGFRRLGKSSPIAYSHPFGLGPILDGLFFQSNFGIVTSACFRLYPKHPREIAISLSLKSNNDLPLLIDELLRLKREGLLTSVTHIANRVRSRSSLSYGIASYLQKNCHIPAEQALKETMEITGKLTHGEWASLSSISGTNTQVRAAIREIRSRTKKYGFLKLITDKKLDIGFAITDSLRFFTPIRACAAAIYAMRLLHRLALGIPTDNAVENLLWNFKQTDLHVNDFDQSRCGLLFINPALPPDGKFTQKILEGMETIAKHHDHCLHITLNIETDTSLVAIINLLFDRSCPKEMDRAHRCADALLDYLHQNKLEVYRARADVHSIVHTHPPAISALASSRQPGPAELP